MEEVRKMYAMSSDDPTREPLELDPNLEDEFAADEDEEIETSTVLTTSDDDEPVIEEAVIVIVSEPVPPPPPPNQRKKPPKSPLPRHPALLQTLAAPPEPEI